MRGKQDKIFEKLMRKEEPKLKKIKDENKRNAKETELLWEAGVAADVELEDELEEEAAEKRLVTYEKLTEDEKEKAAIEEKDYI